MCGQNDFVSDGSELVDFGETDVEEESYEVQLEHCLIWDVEVLELPLWRSPRFVP